MEPGGQEATALGSDCKLNGNSTERLARSDRCDSILEQSNLSPIQQFYNGQSIFITGGTGFVGKLLIEKLLRECPGISFVYLLIRPKKGKDMHQRIEEIFDDPVNISHFILNFFLQLLFFPIFELVKFSFSLFDRTDPESRFSNTTFASGSIHGSITTRSLAFPRRVVLKPLDWPPTFRSSLLRSFSPFSFLFLFFYLFSVLSIYSTL